MLLQMAQLPCIKQDVHFTRIALENYNNNDQQFNTHDFWSQFLS